MAIGGRLPPIAEELHGGHWDQPLRGLRPSPLCLPGFLSAGILAFTLSQNEFLIHHYRLVHWSAPNTSPAERRLLINAYAAADTVSLMADTTGSPLYGRLVRGTPPRVARRTAGEMPLPPDFREGNTSIYELQRQAASINP